MSRRVSMVVRTLVASGESVDDIEVKGCHMVQLPFQWIALG